MLRRSSSISSSSPLGRRRRVRRKTLAVLASTAAALLLLDAAVGVLARQPDDPRQQPNNLARYFNYGESIESKLRRQVGATPEEDAPIVQAGWIRHECDKTPTPRDPAGVSVYGMSFSQHVARDLAALDPQLHVAGFAGPGAPLNHSYTCFRMRQAAGIDGNRTQVLGILAGSLRRTVTTSGLGTSFEQPQPFTYPRYRLERGHLVAVDPPIADLAGLRSVLATHDAWRDYIAALGRQDPFVSPFLSNHDLLDYSIVAKMLRRGWGQRHIDEMTARLRGGGDFDGDPQLVAMLQALVIDFTRRVRAAGGRPVILLFEDRGYDGVLRRTIVPTLTAHHVPYVLSADIAPATDASIFLPDGHFLPSIDRKIAEALRPIIVRGNGAPVVSAAPRRSS
jgi:hypothetical protein